MKSTIFNLVAFQIGWFACVLGAANGLPWVGIAYVLLFAVMHLAFVSVSRKGDVVFLLSAGLAGVVFDGVLMALGLMSFPLHAEFGPDFVPPLWMAAMWINLALALRVSLRWLIGRYWLGIAFGAIGGPLAYVAGEGLGAIELSGNHSLALTAIAVEWALAMPLLLVLAERLATHKNQSRSVTSDTLQTAEATS